MLLLLVRIHDLGGNVPEAVLAHLLTGTLYLASVFLALRERRDCTRFIIIAAVVFRVTVWPLYPTLSDDAYRYRWEGKLQAAGGNPYTARPNDPAWRALQDETFPRVGGRDFRAGYGPLTEAIAHGTYRAVAAFTGDPWKQVFWFKLPAACFDLLTVAAVFGLVRAHRLTPNRALVYAWCPLPIVEFWTSGHNDAVAIFFVVLALMFAARDRWAWAMLALSLGAAAKLWPALLIPLFLVEAWRRRQPLLQVSLPAMFAIAALAAPYATDVAENVRHMSGFIGGWRNNDSIFGLTLHLAGDFYTAKYITVSAIVLAVIAAALSHFTLVRKAVVVIAAVLVLSANFHPWYAIWFLPLLAIDFYVPLLVWALLAPIGYEAVIGWRTLGEWRGVTGLRWAIHAPCFLLALAYAMRTIGLGRKAPL